MKPKAAVLLAAACLSACAPAPRPQVDISPWVRSEDAALPERNFPFSSMVQRRLLARAHESADSEAVTEGLRRLARIGYAPTEETLTLLSRHLPEGEMDALRLRFDANRAAVEASRLVETVPADQRLVEGIAWDERGDRLFASTVVSRELLVRDSGGWRAVEGIDGGSLFGLAIDRRRNLLWAGSGRLDETPSPESAFRGLIAIDLATLRVVRRLVAPGEGFAADLVVAPDGTVYGSDPLSGAVYRAAPGDSSLSILVPPGRLHSAQGLAVSRDGRWLYVSDYVQGLAIVRLADGTLGRLSEQVSTMLDGIDGLYTFGDGLLAVQNGTNPRRILFLMLDVYGARVTDVRVLESNHSGWGEPTLGTVRGREFLYVADAQWEAYGAGGTLRGERPPRATAIRLLRPFG